MTKELLLEDIFKLFVGILAAIGFWVAALITISILQKTWHRIF